MNAPASDLLQRQWRDLYPRVACAIRFLAEEAPRQPALAEIAEVMEASPSHAQRVFQQWAGLSPKRVSQVLTWRRARQRLRSGDSVLQTTFDAELSGPGRLHDLAISLEAMTPGEVGALGAGLTITIGQAWTPLGLAVIASTHRGLCGLHLIDGPEEAEAAQAHTIKEWPRATVITDDAVAQGWAGRIFAASDQRAPLSLLVRGTNFQVSVWRALLALPAGETTTYGALAHGLGRPKSARAVGQAVGRNPVAWLIPCHRVLASDGGLGGYRWGLDRKQMALCLDAPPV